MGTLLILGVWNFWNFKLDCYLKSKMRQQSFYNKKAVVDNYRKVQVS